MRERLFNDNERENLGIALDKKVKAEFQRLCKKQGSTASVEIRKFIYKFVSDELRKEEEKG